MMLNLLKNWETDDLRKMLLLLVGRHYGDNPVDHLEEIIRIKHHEAQNIIQHLNLSSNDSVIDLGSGCGFIAENIADYVDKLACVDISRSFLDYARLVNKHHINISYHHISHGQLDFEKKVNAIYSVAVFIHFNLYDCYWYLTQCYRCLENRGRMLFDILNAEKLDIHNDVWQRHSQYYIQDRSNLFLSIYYNDKTTIRQLAEQIGFTVDNIFDENDHSFFILRKC